MTQIVRVNLLLKEKRLRADKASKRKKKKHLREGPTKIVQKIEQKVKFLDYGKVKKRISSISEIARDIL